MREIRIATESGDHDRFGDERTIDRVPDLDNRGLPVDGDQAPVLGRAAELIEGRQADGVHPVGRQGPVHRCSTSPAVARSASKTRTKSPGCGEAPSAIHHE